MVGGSSGGSVEKSVEHLGSGATAGVKLGERSLGENVGEGRGGGGGKSEEDGGRGWGRRGRGGRGGEMGRKGRSWGEGEGEGFGSGRGG